MAVAACGGLDRLSEDFGASDAATDAQASTPTTDDSSAVDAAPPTPQLCTSQAPALPIGRIGNNAVIDSLALSEKYVFAGNAEATAVGGLYRMPKSGGLAVQIARKEGVENVLVVGNVVYFTATEAGGTLWSCPVEGTCLPAALGSSKSPVAMLFQNGQLYFQDQTIARTAPSGSTLGPISHATFKTSWAFVADKDDVFYIDYAELPYLRQFSLVHNTFLGLADGGSTISKISSPKVVDGSISLPDSFSASWTIAQSSDYVFWGTYSADTKRGLVVRDPKRSTGLQCIYGGIRPESRPYATAYHGGYVFWSNQAAAAQSTLGSIECCPVEGRCCPGDPTAPKSENEPTRLVPVAREPGVLAVDDSGVYFASVTGGSVYRVAPR